MDFAAMFMKVCTKNGLVFSFMLIGIITLITYKLSGLTKGKVHGSAIAIFAAAVSALIFNKLPLPSEAIVDIIGI